VAKPQILPASSGFLLGLLFDPRYGGNVLPKRRADSKLYCITAQKTALFSHGSESLMSNDGENHYFTQFVEENSAIVPQSKYNILINCK
jgi:hypothetical protein